MAQIQRRWSTKRQFRILAMIFGVALIYLLPFFAMPGLAAIYLKIDGIEGESTSSAFPKMIEVYSLQFNAGRAISKQSGNSNRTSSAPTFSEIIITKGMDKSSVPLFKESVIGASGKSGVLYFTQTGEGNEVSYYEIALTNAL